MGRLDEAAAQAQKAEQLAPVWVYHEEHSAVVLLDAVVLLRGGQAAQGRRILVGLEQRWQRQYFPPEQLAYGWAQFGERDRALRWLEEGVRWRSGFAVFSLVHPWLAPLRGDPRFERILRRVGLLRPQPR